MRLSLLAVILFAGTFAHAFSFQPIVCEPFPLDVLESAICGSPEAVELDRKIAQQLNQRVPLCDLESIKEHQREFLKDRNSCSNGGNFMDVQDCVLGKLQLRFDILEDDGAKGYFCP